MHLLLHLLPTQIQQVLLQVNLLLLKPVMSRTQRTRDYICGTGLLIHMCLIFQVRKVSLDHKGLSVTLVHKAPKALSVILVHKALSVILVHKAPKALSVTLVHKAPKALSVILDHRALRGLLVILVHKAPKALSVTLVQLDRRTCLMQLHHPQVRCNTLSECRLQVLTKLRMHRLQFRLYFSRQPAMSVSVLLRLCR